MKLRKPHTGESSFLRHQLFYKTIRHKMIMPWYSYSTCSRCSLVDHESPYVLLAIKKNVKGKKKINTEEKSLHHVDKVTKFHDLNSLWSCKHGRKKWQKWHVWLFLCIIALGNKTVALSSIVWQIMQMAVSAKKDGLDSELLLPWQHDLTLLLSIQCTCYWKNLNKTLQLPTKEN